MREADLYLPVRDWLRSQGYDVYVEVFDCDVVGVNGQCLVAVELKLSLTWELEMQCLKRAGWADFVWAAISTAPDKGRLDRFTKGSGFGILQITNDRVKKRRKAQPQPWPRLKRRAYCFHRLEQLRPALEHHRGGLSACRQLREQNKERRADTPPAEEGR